MKLNRALYLGYYLKELDREKFALFLNHTIAITGKTKTSILTDILKSVFTYNISILEYFQFRFFELSEEERKEWAGTGYMYEYQLAMNPESKRHILDDKTLFYKNYQDFFVHTVADREGVKKKETARKLLTNPAGKLVFKESDGKCGAQVEIRNCSEFSENDITQFMDENSYDLVEEFIDQHSDINKLSPSAVNTIRIITQITQDREVEILGCRFRISVNSSVDNMAAGNIAAPVDQQSGIVSGPAVYSDITKPDCKVHPITEVKIPGFQIPYWNEILDMVKKAALKHPQNRSIGWDVVVTEQEPGLIEGNHDWCKLLWQLPVKQGLKHLLEPHFKPAYSPKKKAVKRRKLSKTTNSW